MLTFEPPPPQEVGVVNLYSREFNALAEQRLAEGGKLAQWIPLHQPYEELQKMLIRTLLAEYPHVSLWLPNHYEGIAIASREPLQIDPAKIAERMSGEIASDLAAVGIGSVEELLATFVAADSALADWVGPGLVLTDDQPAVEYFLAYEPTSFRNAHVLPHREPVERYLVSPVDPDRLDLARRQIELLRVAEDAHADGRWSEAVAGIDSAVALDPSDPYLTYLAAWMREQSQRGER